jgi:hypothetical protein
VAEIVLGVGTSHSPLLAIAPELWSQRGDDDRKRTQIHLADGRVVSYAALADEVGNVHASRATTEVFRGQSQAAHVALDHLAAAIERAAPDVIIVIGDDQQELFTLAHMPAIAVYTGADVVMHPKNEVSPGLPAWYRQANKGYLMDTVHRHPAAPALALNLVESLVAEGVDVSIATEVADAHKAGFGHAYGFVIDRLLARRPVPILPLMLNTYFPPNVPTPRRCYEVGQKIARAIRAMPDGITACVLASGGLTHFATDEAFDRHVLEAMRRGDAESLCALPVAGLRSGNSEILNWVMAAGALESLRMDPPAYIPVHRTSAGTGIGLAFATWHP